MAARESSRDPAREPIAAYLIVPIAVLTSTAPIPSLAGAREANLSVGLTHCLVSRLALPMKKDPGRSETMKTSGNRVDGAGTAGPHE
jgi:hypothetical protein